jgi:hypothetical protein
VIPGISQVAVYEITQIKTGFSIGNDANSFIAAEEDGPFTSTISWYVDGGT